VFERYTEPARRVLFFSRYAASQLGGRAIETEHLLVGLLREGKGLTSGLFARAQVSLDAVQSEIKARTPVRESIPTSVEIPFSTETKRVLRFTAEEADRLGHTHIGPEHLLLGLLSERQSMAAVLLEQKGIQLDTARQEIIRLAKEEGLTWGG